MFSLFLSWIIQPKNAILTAILVAFLTLFAHDRHLNHEVNVRDENIANLNKNISDLKASIDLQNLAIKKMNNDYVQQKNDFEKQLTDTQNINQPKIKYIEKQQSYTSPVNVQEVDATHQVFDDFLKNRKGVTQ